MSLIYDSCEGRQITAGLDSGASPEDLNNGNDPNPNSNAKGGEAQHAALVFLDDGRRKLDEGLCDKEGNVLSVALNAEFVCMSVPRLSRHVLAFTASRDCNPCIYFACTSVRYHCNKLKRPYPVAKNLAVPSSLQNVPPTYHPLPSGSESGIR